MRRVLLVVEDDLNDEILTLRALRQQGDQLEVRVVRDGLAAAQALGLAAADEPAPDLPDLVLLDLKLPRIDGHELLRALKTDPRTSHIRVVAYSSSGEPRDVEAALSAGAAAYIIKPIGYDEYVHEIADAVRTALDRVRDEARSKRSPSA